MAERRQRPEDARVGHQDVELPPPLVESRAEPVDAVEILEIARHEGRLAAKAPDLVIELFERALRPGQRDHVGAGAGEIEGDGATDAARGARDEGQATVEVGGHVDSNALCLPPTSVRPRSFRPHVR